MFRCLLLFSFLIAGANAAQGQPANDNRTNAIIISGTNVLVTGSNVGATAEPFDPAEVDAGGHETGGKSVWWKWTPEFNGAATLATGLPEGTPEQNSTFDTQLGVYVIDNNLLTEVASSEDATELETATQFGLSKVSFEAEAGQTYYIMVNGWQGEEGDIRLYLEQMALHTYDLELDINPFNAGSLSVSPQSGNGAYPSGSQVSITAHPAEGFVFLEWRGNVQSTNNPVTLIMNENKLVTALFSNEAPGFAVTLSSTTGGQVAADIPPNAANGTYAPNTRLTFTATPSANFKFDAWTGSFSSTNNPLSLLVTSNITINANFSTTLPPENDDFENATLLESSNVVASGNNNNATMQSPPEPLDIDFTPSMGKSVWWRWIAPLSGPTTVATGVPEGSLDQQSEFDTLLAVYTGSSRSNLTQVASNDDGAEFPTPGLSLLRFNAIAGETYFILVDSYDGETGGIRLYLTNSAPPIVRPELSITLESNAVVLRASSRPGAIHTLQSSTNLVHWEFRSLITNGVGQITDPVDSPARFYRIED